MIVAPRRVTRPEDGAEPPMLVWAFGMPMQALSSASVGGGRTAVSWVINAQVDRDYRRVDVEAHAAELARAAAVTGDGVTMLTAAAIDRVVGVESDGLRVDATVGVSRPVWAADPTAVVDARVDTINVVVQVGAPLAEGALVNMVITATEAKTQALVEAGIEGTGTASDAVTVICPAGGSEPFGGPRSSWGHRIALAVRDAVAAGLEVDPS